MYVVLLEYIFISTHSIHSSQRGGGGGGGASDNKRVVLCMDLCYIVGFSVLFIKQLTMIAVYTNIYKERNCLVAIWKKTYISHDDML